MRSEAARYLRVISGERKEGAALPASLDLHVHALLSKTFAFELASVERLQRAARDRRLSAFALTEHIHAADFWRAHALLAQRFSYADGVYLGGAVPMFSGAEITCRGAGDLVVIGDLDAIRALDRRFRPRLSEGAHPTLAEFLAESRDLPLIRVGAHPFRPGKELHRCPRHDLRQLDAIETNGRDTGLLGGNVGRVRHLADRLGLPVVGSSDTHFWPQLGVVHTVTSLDPITLLGLRTAIARGSTRVRIRADVAPLVRFCRSHKKYIKAHRAAERPRLGEEVA